MNSKLLALAAVVVAVTLQSLTAAAHAEKPSVIVNLNNTTGLISTPVPEYPEEARQHGWNGIGLFEPHFKRDGTVGEVIILLSTDHKVLDETAKAALGLWRCRPGAPRVATITMTFRSNHSRGVVSLEDEASEKKRANFTSAPHPNYPYEARRQKWVGSGVFLLHFRPDGMVDKVLPIRSTGNPILDAECKSTFSKWRCRPGVYTVIQVPINFTMQGYRGR